MPLNGHNSDVFIGSSNIKNIRGERSAQACQYKVKTEGFYFILPYLLFHLSQLRFNGKISKFKTISPLAQ